MTDAARSQELSATPPSFACFRAASVPSFDHMVLLVRHAERSAITDIRSQSAAGLTDQGRSDSVVYGRMLAHRFVDVVVWHSPIPRCRETADLLIAGASELGGTLRIGGALPWLAGNFIGGNPQWINDQIAASGHDGFVRQWFDGRYSQQDITPLQECSRFVMSQVRIQLDRPEATVTVDVTHDWVLLFLREAVLGLRHEEVGIPLYLDSVAVLRQGTRVFISSVGRSEQLIE